MVWGSCCITGKLASCSLSSLAVSLGLRVEQGMTYFQKSALTYRCKKSISSVLYHYRLTGENRHYFLYSLASTVWSCSLFEKVTKTFAGELENNDFSSHSSEFICMSTVWVQLRSSWERLSVQFFFFFPSRVSMAFKMIAFCSAPETWVVRLLYTSGTVSDKYWEYKQGSDEKAR